MELATDIYRLTFDFPDEEKYGLISQLRRAAVSVPSNIAEGHGRNTPSEMIRFTGIALGSIFEIETQLLLSKQLGIAPSQEVDRLLEKTSSIGRMLHGLIRANRDR